MSALALGDVMTRPARWRVVASALALSALIQGGCVDTRRVQPLAQPDVPAVEIVRREENLSLPAGTKVLRVHNLHGDVRVRFSDRIELRMVATVQRIGAHPLDPLFRLTVERDAAITEVHYAGERVLLARGGHQHGRSDILLVAPRSLRVEIETGDGLAQVRNAREGVRVRTSGGSIEVSGAGDLDLESRGGRIAFSQSSGEWPRMVSARSHGGEIFATIPAFADIELDARAGEIGVDPLFPLNVGGEPGARTATARFGRALRTLEIDAGSGKLYLRAGIAADVITRPAANSTQ